MSKEILNSLCNSSVEGEVQLQSQLKQYAGITTLQRDGFQLISSKYILLNIYNSI